MDMKLIVVRLFFIMVLCGSVGNWEQGKKETMARARKRGVFIRPGTMILFIHFINLLYPIQMTATDKKTPKTIFRCPFDDGHATLSR